ncbi:MAG: hypothetical protein RIE08_13790 [Acidimicrobiales bacterium]
MTASAETTALDLTRPFRLGTEQRFPLDLTSSSATVWDAYETALREVWDPEDEALWKGFDVATYDEATRAGGALVWSHLAWIEFPAIAESEAVLIRACLEPGVDIDLKYCLSMRAVERARSTDLAHMVAARLDHYESEPTGTGLAGLLDDELVRRALHVDSDLDAYIAAHLGAQATVDLRMWEAAAANAREPLAGLIGLVVRDKARMLEVAWTHLAETIPGRTEADRRAIAAAVEYVIVEEELRGRRVPALLAAGTDRDGLMTAHSVAATAGLAGVTEAEQLDAVESALTEVAARLADLDIVIAPVTVAGR